MLAKQFFQGPLGVMLVAAAIGTLYTVNVKDARSRSARCRYDEAMEAIQYEEPIRALQLLQEAVRLDPDCAEYHASLAVNCSNYRYQAVELLNLEMPSLYGRILSEARDARMLSPDDVAKARDYAFYCMDAEKFGVTTDWDVAFEAWNTYLDKHRRHPDPNDRTGIVRSAVTCQILVRLARIEVAKYVQQAVNLDPLHDHPSLFVSDYLREQSKVVGPRLASLVLDSTDPAIGEEE